MARAPLAAERENRWADKPAVHDRMNQVYWLDPLNPSDLLEGMLRLLAGGARLAVEGDAASLAPLQLDSIDGASHGPVEPFTREHGADSVMVVLRLDNMEQARLIHSKLAPGGALVAGVGAIQLERGGSVQFLAGDGFHRECISVGPLVPVEFLHGLVRSGVIAGFYTKAEALQYFGRSECE